MGLPVSEGRSQVLRVREKTAVNRVNNWLCSDLPTAEESSIQATNGIVASRYFVELEIDVSLSIGIE